MYIHQNRRTTEVEEDEEDEAAAATKMNGAIRQERFTHSLTLCSTVTLLISTTRFGSYLTSSLPTRSEARNFVILPFNGARCCIVLHRPFTRAAQLSNFSLPPPPSHSYHHSSGIRIGVWYANLCMLSRYNSRHGRPSVRTP